MEKVDNMPFDYYFAGATTPRIEQVLVSLNANVLKSFYTDKPTLKRWFSYKEEGWTGKLLIDNGEFSMHRHGGTIDIDEYIAYLNENDDYIDHAIALDKIPGVWGTPHSREDIAYASDVTYQNYLYMVSKCKSPNKLLPVYHQEEDISCLEKFLSIPGLEYLCIAGRKDLTPQSRKAFYAECFSIIQQSNNPTVHVHCLGSGTLADMQLFPLYSSDSTSCNMVAANGNIFIRGVPVYVGDGGKSLSQVDLEIVNKVCDENNVKLADLINYQDRAIFNIRYMYSQSKITEFVPRNLIKESLF